jgi:hypothetical protein
MKTIERIECDTKKLSKEKVQKMREIQKELKEMYSCYNKYQDKINSGECEGSEGECFGLLKSCIDPEKLEEYRKFIESINEEISRNLKEQEEALGSLDREFGEEGRRETSATVTATCDTTPTNKCCGFTKGRDSILNLIVGEIKCSGNFSVRLDNETIILPINKSADEVFRRYGANQEGKHIFTLYCDSEKIKDFSICYCRGDKMKGCFEANCKDAWKDCLVEGEVIKEAKGDRITIYVPIELGKIQLEELTARCGDFEIKATPVTGIVEEGDYYKRVFEFSQEDFEEIEKRGCEIG